MRLCAPGIDVGAEIVTNYGEVSNADHLMSHGFALRGSTHETFALSVAGGVFDICPAGGDDQFPWGLYESFASSPEVILEARALVLQAFRRNEDRVRSKPETRVVLTAILRACREAVRPFDATCRRDKALLAPPGPEASVATYRLGQWRILNDAIHVLEDALQRRKRKWRKLWERRRLQLKK